MKVAFMMLSLAAMYAFSDTIEELNLTADYTINVPTGATTDVERVTGGAYTITKTGGGVVRFGFVQNKAAKLAVEEGQYFYYIPDATELLAAASLHMDANDMNNADYSQMIDGTNFITRWYSSSVNDGEIYASHDTYAPAYRNDADKRLPFVRKAYLNGLDIVDFGSLQTPNNVDSAGNGIGHGAAMVLSERIDHVRDLFFIGGHTEDVANFKANYPSSKDGMTSAGIIGSGEWNAFWPGLFSDAPAVGNPPLINRWQTKSVYQSINGQIYVNDDVFTGSSTHIFTPGGVNYFNFRLVDPSPDDQTERSAVYRFARWSDKTFGGARIGEVVVFIRCLNDSEHRKIENYLRSKWFKPHFARVTMNNTERLEKCSPGTAYNPGFSTAPDILVTDGSLVIDPLSCVGCWIRLDASQIDESKCATVGDKTVIDAWTDAAGGPHRALHSTRVPTWRKNPENRKPFLSSCWASNDLKVVDFGYPQNPNVVDAAGNGIGYGAGMEFDALCSTIREVLIVAGDYEETKTILEDYPVLAGKYNQSMSMFIGATTSGLDNYFGRYNFENGKMPIVINPWQSYTKPVTTNANGVTVDGVTYSVGSSVRLTPGLHLMNFRALDNMSANGIGMHYANENYGNFGGVRIGELMIFETELSGEMRSRVTKTLMNKWLNRPPHVYACGTVEVTADGRLSVPYAAVSAERLVLGGTLSAVSISPAVIEPISAAAAVAGKLDLPASGEVVLDRSLYPGAEAGDVVRVVAADSLAGDPSLWTVSGSLSERFAIKLIAGEDGLYAELAKCGFTLIVR